jgi:hypothetical protein
MAEVTKTLITQYITLITKAPIHPDAKEMCMTKYYTKHNQIKTSVTTPHEHHNKMSRIIVLRSLLQMGKS